MSTEPALVDAAVRAGWILATDDALAAQCEIDRYRASGPGGQHRNKTESAVRVRHKASGLSAIAEESRAQHENKARALKRLREHVAIDLRALVAAPSARLTALVAGGTAPLGERTREKPEYLIAIAELLDVFADAGAEVAACAQRLGVTTGAMSKLLMHDERVARAVNRMRHARGLRPLR
ncbi:MAG TPA: peptide chain release factor-like protein [Kofleriaceae bacterium]|jgi:hypothetical protein|nr:peptide chain release factor-like protein [Kofleriaceae bacterium]